MIGTILDDKAKKDAIHIAIYPGIAAERLKKHRLIIVLCFRLINLRYTLGP